MAESPGSGRLAEPVERALRDDHRRIVITGSGGWLGMATLELLKTALGTDISSRIACFGSARRMLHLTDGSTIEQQPLAALAGLAPMPTFVLHLAFLTKDRAEAMDEAEYRRANRSLSRTVLDSLDRIAAQAVFVASSGAAAFADAISASPAMRLYGALKGQDEEDFAAWAQTGDRKAVLARSFNLSGPHINKHASYALASFILDALAGRPIAVRAAHPVVRGYVAIRELMSLVFALMLEGEASVVRFDSGGTPMEMAAIAQGVADLVGPVAVHRPALGGDPADEYVGDDSTYRRLLAERGIESVPFAQQVIETARFLAGK